MSNLNKENKLEKIYTSKPLINHLFDLLDTHYNEEITEFLEPASGSGNIINSIKEKYNQNIIAFDIFNETNRSDIIQQDFLKTNIQYKKGRVCIMNPPFMKGIVFFKKCLQVCDIVISILSINSFLNINYNDYNCELIELINKQPFCDGKKYDICIVVIKNKITNKESKYFNF
jgi:hypothetical protein